MRKLVSLGLSALGLFATPAMASPFSVEFDGYTSGNGPLNFTLSGDTSSQTGRLVYNEEVEAPDGIGFISTGFTDMGATIAPSGVSRSVDMFGETIVSATFVVSDSAFNFDVDDEGMVTTRNAYTLRFDLAAVYTPTGDLFSYEMLDVAPIVSPMDSLQSGDTTVTGSLLSAVPLPGSGLLFGAALVGLGFAAALRRRSGTDPRAGIADDERVLAPIRT